MDALADIPARLYFLIADGCSSSALVAMLWL